jgi:CubicO group peptidase (beta-lactamase class C family)
MHLASGRALASGSFVWSAPSAELRPHATWLADFGFFLVYQAGALRLEEYFYGYDRNRWHEMRSFTKSVIALLAGAAVDRGRLRADEPVLGRLGYAAYANPDPRKDRITLLDLLSNRSGLACNDHDSASPGHEGSSTTRTTG